jgi:putative hydrolase of the HAD superfamily
MPLVVFDLDDTLYPEHAFVQSGFRAAGDWLHRNHGISGLAEIAMSLFERGVRGTNFDDSLRQLGCSTDLVRSLIAVYRDHEPRIVLYPDAVWALTRLRSSNRIGVLTDGALRTQQRKVHALAIASMVDFIVYSDEFGRDHWKPSAIPYQRAMDLGNCEGHDCIYVADNPEKDFVTARALGWTTIHVRRAGGEYAHRHPRDGYGADHTITTLFEIEDIIGAGGILRRQRTPAAGER